ncbi:MAG: HupE/UreJ family protein [Acidiferrobacterales bacterium]
MRNLLLGLLLVAISGMSPVAAHDIGVSQAELIEQDGNRYVLSVRASPAVAYLYAAPLLPEHCQFVGNPRGAQGVSWRRFEFACNDALTADHTLLLPWRRDGAVLTARWLDGSESKQLFRNEAGRIDVPLAELQAGSGSWFNAAQRYTGLGIEHILLGVDHLLFVLALLLIVRGPWMLVKTITAFTVAHSITLGLATLGFIHVPSRPVEAAIALSIMFLCVEIIHARQHRISLTYRYPWLVAFAFGLLHGLGFAGALSEIGLPEKEIPLALLFFNIGVEIGQLIFVSAVLALAWMFRRLQFDSWTWASAIPVYAIGTLATYWFVQRLATMFPVA